MESQENNSKQKFLAALAKKNEGSAGRINNKSTRQKFKKEENQTPNKRIFRRKSG